MQSAARYGSIKPMGRHFRVKNTVLRIYYNKSLLQAPNAVPPADNKSQETPFKLWCGSWSGSELWVKRLKTHLWWACGSLRRGTKTHLWWVCGSLRRGTETHLWWVCGSLRRGSPAWRGSGSRSMACPRGRRKNRRWTAAGSPEGGKEG